MSPMTYRQRCRLLRQAVAELYAVAGGSDPDGTDMDRFISDLRVAREAQVAVTLVSHGRNGNGNGS